MPLVDLKERTFRSNSQYELIEFSRLPNNLNKYFQYDIDHSTLFGILHPRNGSSLTVRVACHSTAKLFGLLQTPRKLPAHIYDSLDKYSELEIIKLILDGVLEIENEGGFVTGPPAFSLVDHTATIHATTRLAHLSNQALRYAQQLSINDIHILSSRLYFYNRVPYSSKWRAVLYSLDAVVNHLKIYYSGDNWPSSRHWVRDNHNSNSGWHMWRAKSALRINEQIARPCKLYISPDTDHIAQAFGCTVRVLTHSYATAFKIGNDAYGLLRPDKLVAYFSNYQDLKETAAILANELYGCPPHGVPFTSEITPGGLLSWGIDPPKNKSLGLFDGSWRNWITNRLASAILACKQHNMSTIPPWQYALSRLHMEGINTTSWTPADDLWNEID